jgi:glycosyltransferase involved in cell wall biosynthesis
MRLLLVGNYAMDEQASMLRYMDMIAAAMRERGHQVETLQPAAIAGRLPAPAALRKWIAYVDKYLLFPMVLRRRSRGFELTHICDHSNSVYLPHVRGASSITCHDLLAILSAKGRYPQNPVSSTGRILQRWIGGNLAKARNVVCVSTETARELTALRGSEPEHMSVILNPLNFLYRPAPLEAVMRLRERMSLADAPYLLHVGGDHWYKNRPGVVRIYAALRTRMEERGIAPPLLVLAGKPWPAELRALIGSLDLQACVVEAAEPSNVDLGTLYSGAAALLFPSLYEGFGWPILEAQSCGCPVITTGRAPMTEVAGKAALLIDPADEEVAATHIAASWNELTSLRASGFANLARFDRETILNRYEEFFLQSVGDARVSAAAQTTAAPPG